jgi:hypothetical protein
LVAQRAEHVVVISAKRRLPVADEVESSHGQIVARAVLKTCRLRVAQLFLVRKALCPNKYRRKQLYKI